MNAAQLSQTLARMGMPLYGAQPPTGYSAKSDAWVTSSALIDRMNFSLALSAGRIHGATVNATYVPAGASASETLASVTNALLAGDVSAQTRDTVMKQVEGGTSVDPRVITGLLLGSPDFQRR